MPSPFPGMDPFIEQQEWEDFHSTFNTVLREQLSERIGPKYIARVERRVYVEAPPHDEDLPPRWADVAVLLVEPSDGGVATSITSTAELATDECLLPLPMERRETYLVIRERETHEVVTVIETLSPANKRSGDGRREYLTKREAIHQSRTHLVELDLLRGGLRLPTVTPLPKADYYAIISRSYRRPRATLKYWTLRDPLPTIPIPLKRGDPDVELDLQTAFTTVYDRARYQLSLNYGDELLPALSDGERQWLAELTASKPTQ